MQTNKQRITSKKLALIQESILMVNCLNELQRAALEKNLSKYLELRFKVLHHKTTIDQIRQTPSNLFARFGGVDKRRMRRNQRKTRGLINGIKVIGYDFAKTPDRVVIQMNMTSQEIIESLVKRIEENCRGSE